MVIVGAGWGEDCGRDVASSLVFVTGVEVSRTLSSASYVYHYKEEPKYRRTSFTASAAIKAQHFRLKYCCNKKLNFLFSRHFKPNLVVFF